MSTTDDAAPPADRSAPAPVTQETRVPHRWRNLMTLMGVLVVDSTEGGLTNGLFPTIARTLGLDNGHLGVLAAAGKAISIPFGPLWVWIGERTSRRAVLSASTALAGVFGILAGFSNSFVTLLLFNTLMAAAIIASQPIANAVVSDTFGDKDRGRAVGILYGGAAVTGSILGPIIAQLSRFSDGWRWGLWIIGGVCLIAALVILVAFKDPGVGAAETQLADLTEEQREKSRPTWRSVMGLFRIPTYLIMMASRLLSGHLLVAVFGIQFLVTVRGFDNATAAIVAFPYGIGYFVGTLGGGLIVSALDRVAPMRGRVFFIQAAQVAFAAVAFFATQIAYTGIGVYALLWGLMGVCQGLNPGVNRPIVMAVTLPELRGQAMAIMITVFEAIGWALFSILAGLLAKALGLQGVFLWVLVVVMLVNAAVLSLLHWTYPKDVRRLESTLDRRRSEALA